MPQPVLRSEGALWANKAQVCCAKRGFHGKHRAQPVCVHGTTCQAIELGMCLGHRPFQVPYEAGEACNWC